eukprot:4347753-Prymnesium_polylepis.1
MPPAPRPHAASSSSHTNYQGLTNEEDFEQVERATKVDIISTPFDEANPVAGRKAAATKDFHDNAAAGIYVFNPNSGLRAAAKSRGMTPAEQGKKWLELWTEVAKKVQETGGTCFVIVKGTGPGPDDFVIEGNAQKGEVRAAALAQRCSTPVSSCPHRARPSAGQRGALYPDPSCAPLQGDPRCLPIRAPLAAQLNVAELAGIPIEYVKY